MKAKIVICFLLLISFSKVQLLSQNIEDTKAIIESNYNLNNVFFENAYVQYPQIPRGILEAVSFTSTRFRHIASSEKESCTGMPKFYGVMGLILDGKNYFRNNLLYVSKLSGFAVKEMIENPESQIMAYAKAYTIIQNDLKIQDNSVKSQIPVLIALCELPDQNLQQNFALNAHLYSVLTFLNTPYYSQLCSFPLYKTDLKEIFGIENYNVLSSQKVMIYDSEITNNEGNNFVITNREKLIPLLDYPLAIWNPAPSCNFSSRNGTTISAITLHTVQGSYASCISWFKNCDAQVSAHYVLRSIDGQVTQMVNEIDKAWHVGSENPYTIGYEHEGFVDDPSWYTVAMYQSSANLTKNICTRRVIDPSRTFYGAATSGLNVLGACVRIKGHQHYPNQSHTDPGINWNWAYYYKLVNSATTVTSLTTLTGNFYDSGGSSANYGDDERTLTLINPPNASSVTLTFTSFDLEANWDYMYIYNGNSVFSPLIGVYTGTTSPATITSTGGSLLIEFRSDCATNRPGWAASWASVTSDVIPPSVIINNPNHWVNGNFNVAFTDTDNAGGSGVEKSFYQPIDYNGTEWRCNNQNGYFNDNFTSAIHSDWIVPSGGGTWTIYNSHLRQSEQANTNSNIYSYLKQDSISEYMYQWTANINGTGTLRRCGLHFFVDNPTQSQRGNSYLVWFRADDDAVQIYKTTNNNLNIAVVNNPLTINTNTWYDFKVTYNPSSGKLQVFMDNVLVASWVDPSPFKSGSYISFRNGDSDVQFDDFKVRKSRDNDVVVSVGPGAGNDIRNQSPNPLQETCRINSIIKDVAGNWSAQVINNTKVDWTKPNTSVVATNNWQTTNFTANFTDNDALSGIEKNYYQVIDFDGSYWGANPQRGFFIDEFNNTSLPLWTDSTGLWTASNGELVQSNESENNSNIFTPVNQTLSNRYIYQFTAKVEGSGTNKRFGFHFFCDDAHQTNRGNSYFIWFRLNSNQLEFYKTVNNSFGSQQKIVNNIVTVPGQWYDYKVIYDRTTGRIDVFRDDVLLGYWIDPSPYLVNGYYVSFRSGNCKLSVNELKIYRSRSTGNVSISVGTSATNDIRFQNPNFSTFAAKIKSIVCDSASNLSNIFNYDLNIDWTTPLDISYINDGVGGDIDTTHSSTTLSANWAATTDPNSGIAKYWYSIGTTPGGTNMVGWTDNGTNTSFTKNGLTLIDHQVYYVNVKAENAAGLQSNVITSDGQIYIFLSSINEFDAFYGFSVSPNPFIEYIYLTYSLKLPAYICININDMQGKKLYNFDGIQYGIVKFQINGNDLKLKAGTYQLTIKINNDSRSVLLIKY